MRFHMVWQKIQRFRLRNPRDAARVFNRNGHSGATELPLRAELFNLDQLRAHGAALAPSHRVVESRAPSRLHRRLAENEVILVGAYDLAVEAVAAGRRVNLALEWLLDN